MRLRKLLTAGLTVLAVVLVVLAVWIIDSRSRYPSYLQFELTPLKDRIVSGSSIVWAHPIPNSRLTLSDYNKGMSRPGQSASSSDSAPYNICILSEPLSGRDRLCDLPGGETTPCPPTLIPPTLNEFYDNVQVFIDGTSANVEALGSDNILEIPEPILSNAYYLCYRIPLEAGAHRVRYSFRWTASKINDVVEWEFTIVN